MIKTNAMRILDKNKIAYEVMEYDTSDGAIDGISVAKKAGLDANMVFKTLVTQSNDREFIVFVVPVGGELDLKKAAKAAGVKSVSMIPQKLLLPNTGYIHGGCSPVGMKKLFRTFFDITAVNQQKIAVSAGKVGEQMILSPDDLKLVTKGTFATLTRD
ncbi:MAG: Cys-tRNA(Pro) deacylase [Lachnospiraceae bacterium]